MIVVPSLSVEEILERQSFFESAAKRVNLVAKQSIEAGEGFGSHKAYISDVAKRLNSSVKSIASMLIRFNQIGWVELERGDLAGAMDTEKFKDSELEFMEARYHFVRV